MNTYVMKQIRCEMWLKTDCKYEAIINLGKVFLYHQ